MWPHVDHDICIRVAGRSRGRPRGSWGPPPGHPAVIQLVRANLGQHDQRQPSEERGYSCHESPGKPRRATTNRSCSDQIGNDREKTKVSKTWRGCEIQRSGTDKNSGGDEQCWTPLQQPKTSDQNTENHSWPEQQERPESKQVSHWVSDAVRPLSVSLVLAIHRRNGVGFLFVWTHRVPHSLPDLRVNTV